jgi:hypothetical protein
MRRDPRRFDPKDFDLSKIDLSKIDLTRFGLPRPGLPVDPIHNPSASRGGPALLPKLIAVAVVSVVMSTFSPLPFMVTVPTLVAAPWVNVGPPVAPAP